MGLGPGPNASSNVFTCHGTIVFVDNRLGQLRHGQLEYAPQNALLVQEEGRGRFVLLGDAVQKEIAFLPDRSIVVDLQSPSDHDNAIKNEFAVARITQNEFGLKRGDLFLCAEPDGRITLSRTECKTWESFHCRSDASEITGTVVAYRIDGRLLNFFISNRFDYIQSCLLRGDFYDRNALNLIRREIVPGMTFLDIGANIGNHCMFVSKFCNASQIIAIEPNPEAVRILKLNMLLNECRNVNLDYLGLALGSGIGMMRVAYPSIGNIGGAQLFPDDQGGVKCIIGDEILHEEPIGFIKIDVEGSEFDVLEGMKRTISKWRPKILIEVWPKMRSNLDVWCEIFGYVIREHLPMDDNYFLTPKERLV
jgi:FkbM family methyltransferase